ncbi:MAG: hypothetical protein KDD62_02020 [Bdellovibrionales bacterium]|nr:hypothetical protein [Bdellovibrionales bacterium]
MMSGSQPTQAQNQPQQLLTTLSEKQVLDRIAGALDFQLTLDAQAQVTDSYFQAAYKGREDRLEVSKRGYQPSAEVVYYPYHDSSTQRISASLPLESEVVTAIFDRKNGIQEEERKALEKFVLRLPNDISAALDRCYYHEAKVNSSLKCKLIDPQQFLELCKAQGLKPVAGFGTTTEVRFPTFSIDFKDGGKNKMDVVMPAGPDNKNLFAVIANFGSVSFEATFSHDGRAFVGPGNRFNAQLTDSKFGAPLYAGNGSSILPIEAIQIANLVQALEVQPSKRESAGFDASF